MSQVSNYSIKDLELFSGVKAHTIRIWERRYGILSPNRSQSNIRNYSDEQVKDLLNISLLVRKGYKISAIASLPPDERSRLVLSSQSATSHDYLEEQWMLSLVGLDEQRFNEAFNVALLKGFEHAIARSIMPFLRKIGLLWQTGSICTAQEHFFSNLVRQKLIAATGNLGFNHLSEAKKVLLLLPEFEQHELMLLFYNYLFRVRGFNTLYLGQGVPLNGLDKAVGTYMPDIIVTGVAISCEPQLLTTFIRHLQRMSPGTDLYAGGPVHLENVLSEADLDNLLNIAYLKHSDNEKIF
jgi:MerR family transcriptional regulator, light-induced transcriptional regulator